MNITHALSLLLQNEGCDIFGFADLCCLPSEARNGFDYGIIIGLSYTKEAMKENKNNRPGRYYDEMVVINSELPRLANLTAEFLISCGYDAYAKTAEVIRQEKTNATFNTILPHKTVATLAGIGWIGKTAMLVTKEVGSALRLVSVLTDAPLEIGTPITKSKCPIGCMTCVKICPGNASTGIPWEVGLERDVFFDPDECYLAARARAKELLGIDETICGLCISHCPFTKVGLGYK